MNSRLRASLTVGAVMRTISQPTAARSSVCWMLASVSIVSQVIIDWTRIGFSPPMPTLTNPHLAGAPAGSGTCRLQTNERCHDSMNVAAWPPNP